MTHKDELREPVDAMCAYGVRDQDEMDVGRVVGLSET